MFGWFQPRCPIDVREKVWTEQRMQWLIQHFGLEELLKTDVILPTVEYFPERFQEADCDARVVLDRVCRYMGVDPKAIDLTVYSDEEAPGTAGMYEKGTRSTIRVAESQLGDLELLVATLAHETAHVLLHGQNLLSGQEDDHEFVTDLLTVYKGIGVFAANTAVRQRNDRGGGWEWWTINRYGYLSARVYGYAFALFAWIRNETTPPWSGYFAPDASAAFTSGLKYLSKTSDCLLDRDEVEPVSQPRSIGTLISDLDDRSDSVRVAALWELRNLSADGAAAIDSVRQCLHHANSIVRCVAAETIGAIGNSADSVVAELMSQLDSDDDEIRSSFVAAVGQLRPSLHFRGPDGASVSEQFQVLLDDTNPNVVSAAAGALTNYGTDVEDAAPALLRSLTRAVIHCDFANADYFAHILIEIVSDLDAFLNEELASRDEELRRQVIHAVNHVNVNHG